jgi:hypothetical protein
MSKNFSKLEPFCFVLVQALRRHIKRLDGIEASKKVRKRSVKK